MSVFLWKDLCGPPVRMIQGVFWGCVGNTRFPSSLNQSTNLQQPVKSHPLPPHVVLDKAALRKAPGRLQLQHLAGRMPQRTAASTAQIAGRSHASSTASWLSARSPREFSMPCSVENKRGVPDVVHDSARRSCRQGACLRPRKHLNAVQLSMIFLGQQSRRRVVKRNYTSRYALRSHVASGNIVEAVA